MSASGWSPEELRGDDEAEDAVPEKGEAPVCVAPPLGPGGMSEGLPAQLFGGALEQLRQGGGAGGHRDSVAASSYEPAGTRAQTKSTASPTVVISAASSSLTLIP